MAYDCRYETEVRPVMPGNPISRTALLAVAEARARYADHATGRNSRPTNERLAADTGYSVRTVQRADTALRLLGVATEVLRGRQRTRIERLASWRVGDRGRGWASVWALHDHPQLNRLIRRLSPHPRSGPVRNK
ncbi:helix-turn-helix domain-containing protein, partial [Mycobacterium persicum]